MRVRRRTVGGAVRQHRHSQTALLNRSGQAGPPMPRASLPVDKEHSTESSGKSKLRMERRFEVRLSCRARIDDRYRYPPGAFSRKCQAACHRSAGTGWLPGSRHRPARPLPALALVRRHALAHDEARRRHVAGRPSRHRDQCKPGTSPLPARVLRCSSEQSEGASLPSLTWIDNTVSGT